MRLLNEVQIFERLCAEEEKDRLIVTPIIDARQQFQPASVDLRLGTEFRTFRITRFEFLDILQDTEKAKLALQEYAEDHELTYKGKFVLHPGDFALAMTLEYIRLPADLAGRLEGKSTWGRLGLQVHSTAGFVDPGFEGCLTFELINAGKVPIPLYPGLRVAQICFYEIEETGIPYSKKVSSLYGGRPNLIDSRFYTMKEVEFLRPLHRTTPDQPTDKDH